MEKDLREFIALRCERALEEDADYMNDEMSGIVDRDELQQRAEVLCYLKGVRDFARFIGLGCDPLSVVGSHGSQKW